MSVIGTSGKRLAFCVTMVMAAVAANASAHSGQVGTADGQPAEEKMPATPGATTQGGTGATGTTGTAAGAGQAGKKGTTRAGTTPHVFVLIPVEVAARDASTKSGCWAKIYDGENYMGDTLTLTGPISLADMTGPFGLNWDDRVNSIEIGPKATLTVFDNEGFRDQVAQFKGGQKVPDISKKLGFFDEFASVRMTCSK